MNRSVDEKAGVRKDVDFNFLLMKTKKSRDNAPESSDRLGSTRYEDGQEEGGQDPEEDKGSPQSRTSRLPLAQILNLVSEPSKRKSGMSKNRKNPYTGCKPLNFYYLNF
jgi:hypothetical protein